MSKTTLISIKVRERIKALRSEQALTQVQLAEKSGIDYKHIQLLESKNPPAGRIDTLEKICKAFGLQLHQFFDVKIFTDDERISLSLKTKTPRK